METTQNQFKLKIDGDSEAVFIYKVTDNCIRVHYQVDELTGDGLTDEYEVCQITH